MIKGSPENKTNIKVLIVEDEFIMAKDIEHTLNSIGYTVVGIVDTGYGAIKKVIEHIPDIVLLDIKIKGNMDGIKVAEEIRSLDIPVIYLTAYSDVDTLERAKRTDPYGFVTKPFDEVKLQTTIEVALNTHRKSLEARKNERKYQKLLKNKSNILHISTTEGTKLYKKMFSDKHYEIIDTTLQLISEEGIQKVTTKKVGEKMNLSEAAIYKYFRSKWDIYVNIVKLLEEILNDIWAKILDSDMNSIEKLESFFTEWFHFVTENQTFIPILISEEILKGEFHLNENVYNILKKNQMYITELLNKAKREYSIQSNSDTAYLSILIIGSITTLTSDWYYSTIKFDLEKEGKKLMQTIFNII